MNQSGFDFASGIGFDTGRGQAGFDFSQPESAHSKDEREWSRRNSEENAKREKREREQRQKDERERQERARRDESRTRHSNPWESAWDVLGVSYTATKGEIRKAWAAKMKACHPDLGGNVADAQRYNRAYQELKGSGFASN